MTICPCGNGSGSSWSQRLVRLRRVGFRREVRIRLFRSGRKRVLLGFLASSFSLVGSSMAFLIQKFQEVVKTLANSPTFARDPRKIQLEADVNRLFLYTCYNRLGKNAEATDAEEIIDMANKASVADQQKQVQENIHAQIKTFCKLMDNILISNLKDVSDPPVSPQGSQGTTRRSGLSYAIGRTRPSSNQPAVPEIRSLTHTELSNYLKNLVGYTLDIKPSQIPHHEAGRGLFLNGAAEVGVVIAFYPGIIYSPASYRYIPGYPRVDANNPYLITRYDGIVINAQPWGTGGETREVWDGTALLQQSNLSEGVDRSSDQFWRLLSKPLESRSAESGGEVLERRNPLAFAHFANHPAKGIEPNVVVCPYDFPLSETDMRVYIPNVLFGREETVRMKRFGNFWFKSGASGDDATDVPILKTLVLVATRALCDEEIFLNYRLSNSKRRPAWYSPVDEEEDQRRWS